MTQTQDWRETFSKYATAPSGAPVAPREEPGEDDFRRTILRSAGLPDTLQGPPEKGIGDLLREFSLTKRLPVVGTVAELGDAAELVELARKGASGRATDEEMAQLSAWAEDAGRPKSFGYQALDLILEIPKFGVEFALSGGLATGAKTAAKKGAEAAGRKFAIQRFTRRAAERSLEKGAKETKRTMARVLGATRVAAYEVGARTAAQEAMGAAYSMVTGQDTVGGRVSLSTYQKILGGLEFNQDQHGALELVLNQDIPSFVEKLPAGALDALIETGSEMVGGLPIMAKVKALQLKALERVAGKETVKALEDVVRYTEKFGLHAPITEVLEERAGDTARAVASLAMPDDFEGFEAIFPGWEQLAVELTAFSVPGLAGAAIGNALPKVKEQPSAEPGVGDRAGSASEGASGEAGGPSTPAEGLTGEAGEQDAPSTAEVTPEPQPSAGALPEVAEPDPEAVERDVEALRQANSDPSLQVVKPEELEGEQAAEIQGLAEVSRSLGVNLIPVRGENAGALPRAGLFQSAGQIVVDVDSFDPTAVTYHELTHNLERVDPQGYTRLLADIQRLDPEGFAAAAQENRERFGEDTAQEGLAVYTETLASYITTLASPAGRAKIRAALEAPEQVGLLRRILDALQNVLAKVGLANPAKTQAKLLEEARALLDGDFELDKARAADTIFRALQVGAPASAQATVDAAESRVAPEGDQQGAAPSAETLPDGESQAGSGREGRDPDSPQLASAPSPRRKRSKAPKPGTVTEAVPLPQFSRLQKLNRAFADKLTRVDQVQEVMRQVHGRDLPDNLDVEGMARTLPGKITARSERLEREHLEPILDLIKEQGIPWKKANDYLWAKHVPEANAALRDKHERAELMRLEAQDLILNGDKEAGQALLKQAKELDPGLDAIAGMTTAAAEAEVAAFEGEYSRGLELAEKVAAMNREVRDGLARDGLISETARDLWASMFDWYVPLRTAEEKPSAFARSVGFSVPGQDVHVRKGRKSRPDNVLTFSAAQAYNAIKRGETNQVGRSLYDAVTSLGLVEKTRIATEADNVLLGQELAAEELVLKFDGVDHFVRFKDADLARAMKNLNAQQLGKAMRIMSAGMRRWSQMITQWDPEFWVSNLMRDLQAAVINVGEKEQAGLRSKILKGMRPSMQAIWRYERGTEAKDDWDGYAKRFHDAGGRTGWAYLRDFEQQDKQLRKYVERGVIADRWAQAIGFVEDMNSAVELSTRLSVFRALVDSGLSDHQAAKYARGVTVDFNRGGELSPGLNALYLFFNAGLQGNLRFARAVAGSPKVRKLVGSLFIAGAVHDQLMRLLSPEDDDGVPVWDNIAEHEKERNLIFWVPGGDGRYFKLPLPYAYNVPYVFGRLASDVAGDRKSLGEGVSGAIKASLESFSPWQGANLVQAATPSLARPALEIAQNENFAGYPIHRHLYPNVGAKAHYGRENTPAVWHWIAKGLNAASGGDQVEGGILDATPESYEHAVMSYMGGVGKMIERYATLAENAIKGVDSDAKDVPFLRRLYGEPMPYGTQSAFYDIKEDLGNAKKRIEIHTEKGAHKKAAELRRQHRGLLSLEDRLKTAEKRLRELRKRRRSAQSAQEKEEIQRQIDATYARFRRAALSKIKTGA